MTELDLVIRDKYGGDASRVTDEELERLASGEPLAYIIGWVPFLGAKIFVHLPEESGHAEVHSLIPRPETEWWTKKLIEHLAEMYDVGSASQPFSVLDLCAGSGAIGIAVSAAFPHASVTMSEIDANLEKLILKNLASSGVVANVVIGDLFENLRKDGDALSFDFIVTNPPYIPSGRSLEKSVSDFEPHEALFAGEDGLSYIQRILDEAPQHLSEHGELWMECDIENIEKAFSIATDKGFIARILEDQYSRPRVLICKRS